MAKHHQMHHQIKTETDIIKKDPFPILEFEINRFPLIPSACFHDSNNLNLPEERLGYNLFIFSGLKDEYLGSFQSPLNSAMSPTIRLAKLYKKHVYVKKQKNFKKITFDRRPSFFFRD